MSIGDDFHDEPGHHCRKCCQDWNTGEFLCDDPERHDIKLDENSSFGDIINALFGFC